MKAIIIFWNDMVFNKYCSKINNLPLIVGNKNEDQEEQANPNDGQAKDSQILNLFVENSKESSSPLLLYKELKPYRIPNPFLH